MCDFGAAGTDASSARDDDMNDRREEQHAHNIDNKEVPSKVYNTVAAQIEDAFDDWHLDDIQYEDEFEIAYVEWFLA